MNKIFLKEKTIEVFGNGNPLKPGIDYIDIIPGSINSNWTYPTLESFNLQGGRPDHPFPHVTGGFEEKPRGFAKMKFPVGCRKFFFNDELNKVIGSNLFFHNKKIHTKSHCYINRKGQPHNRVWEKPDLFETGEQTYFIPSFNGLQVIDAVNAGHNFIAQSNHGIFNKICNEMYSLYQSGISNIFYIALYSHKQNLSVEEVCSYREANLKADKNYASQLEIISKDISTIDSNYIHLLFRGLRQNGRSTFYSVFILEMKKGFEFLFFQIKNQTKIRPANYNCLPV